MRDYFFVDIPKTASTSIREALGIGGDGHTWAGKRIDEIGQEAWDELFTFTFVRNPWDRAVSIYHFQLQKYPHALYKNLRYGIPHDRPPINFNDWVELVFGEIMPNQENSFWVYRPQTDWYMDGDRPLVNFVGRYERLQEDFVKACALIGRPPRALHWYKKSRHGYWKDAYSRPKSIRIIADYFAKDIEELGYETPK